MIKRKDGRWQEQVKLPAMSKPKYFYGKTQKEVRRKMAEWSQAEEEAKEKAVLFETVADEWFVWKTEAEKIEWNTQKCYTASLREAKEWFSGRDINGIYTDEIMDFLKATADRGLGKSAVSKRKTALCGIWDYAIMKRISRNNPVRAAKMPKNLPESTREPPEDEEMEKVEAAFEGDLGLFPLIQCFTGLRRAEILALTWEDVDFDKNVIRVTKSLEYISNTPRTKRPKSKAGERKVVMLNHLKERLPKGRHGIIFRGKDGGYMRGHEYREMWKKWCFLAGLAEPKEPEKKRRKPEEYGNEKEWKTAITSQQLRHYYATFLYEAGVGLKDMQDLLGHSDPQTTMRVYTHIRKSHKQKTTEMLNAFLCQKDVENGKGVEK